PAAGRTSAWSRFTARAADSSATTSAWACPAARVAPRPVTRPPFTTTAPTGGFGRVVPFTLRACAKARRKNRSSGFSEPEGGAADNVRERDTFFFMGRCEYSPDAIVLFAQRSFGDAVTMFARLSGGVYDKRKQNGTVP